MKIIKKYFCLFVFTLSIFCSSWITTSAQAQVPFIQDVVIYSKLLRQLQEDSLHYACIRVDGHCLFKLASTESESLAARINEIQERLNNLTKIYLAKDNSQLIVAKQETGNSWDVRVRITDNTGGLTYQEERLLTVTAPDAQAYEVRVETRAEQISELLQAGLQKAKQERKQPFLIRQGIFATVTIVAMLLSNLLIARAISRAQQFKEQLEPSDILPPLPIANQLVRRQRKNLREVQYRLLQLALAGVWVGGILFILNLFPYTRIFPFLLIAVLQIPARIVLTALVTYILIRLTYALIAKLSTTFIHSYSSNFRVNQRPQLRVNTIIHILKGVVTVIWIGAGILVVLWGTGVNIAPILAGAGILGLAISLASQNLIKDAINGFFIILEDQYAVGDVITVGEVGGLVENINLRITQLRDAEGRLITIPNSEIKIVANLSSQWSRADITIPVSYQADVDQALDVLNQVTDGMLNDRNWREMIWESPQILGVENFCDRGVMIRVWITTEPLKQWEVAREFRRRVKIALDSAGIPIPLLQQQVWFKQDSAQKNNHS
jgi:moderate conductance mechanosensitive channel